MSRRLVCDALFLVALASVSLIGLRWRVGGVEPKAADILMVAYLAAFVVDRSTARRLPDRSVFVILAFGGALGAIYLAALPEIDGRAELVQFAKGLAYFVLHLAFLAAGVIHVASRTPRFFGLALGCLLAGIAVNGLYGGLQLAVAALGGDLDATVLSPLTGRPSRSMLYGLMYGPDTPRARGVTRDPNHLAAMLLLPTLVLLALTGRAPVVRRPHAAAAALAVLLVILGLTLSRSAAFGLVAGALFLLVTDRRALRPQPILAAVAAAALALGLVAAANAPTIERVLGTRIGLYGFAGRQHFRTYELIPAALSESPLFGVGLNTFDLTYAQRVIGIREASHSFYVQSLTETGLVGALVYGLFLVYVFRRLAALRAPGPAGHEGDDRRAIASALGAALVATLASNTFYMTMSFSYFSAFLVFVLAAATTFARDGRGSTDRRSAQAWVASRSSERCPCAMQTTVSAPP